MQRVVVLGLFVFATCASSIDARGRRCGRRHQRQEASAAFVEEAAHDECAEKKKIYGQAKDPPSIPGGVDRKKISDEENVTIGGKPGCKSDARKMLGAGIPDDASKVRVTIIGTDAERQKVLSDLASAPELRPFAGQFVLQDYPPEHWAVRSVGLVGDGKPTIYCQAPDGTVLHRQDDYADGAKGLAKALEKVRKPNADYDRKKDPDLRKPTGGGGLLDLLAKLKAINTIPLGAWLLLLAGAAAFFKKSVA